MHTWDSFKGKDYLLICGFMELVDKAILGNNKVEIIISIIIEIVSLSQ